MAVAFAVGDVPIEGEGVATAQMTAIVPDDEPHLAGDDQGA